MASHRRRALFLGAGPALGLLLAGCAQLGPVLPPSAQLPRPVEDFHAQRVGPGVRLSWTPPRQTSDGVALRGRVAYNLCVWPGDVVPPPPPPAVAAITKPELNPVTPPQIPSPVPLEAGNAKTPAGLTMPACPHLVPLAGTEVGAAALGSGARVTLALYAVNAGGEGAGWSNPVVVPLTPVAEPPRLLRARPTADGVELSWSLPQPAPQAIHVYRSGVLVAQLPGSASDYLDRGMAWNQHYDYWLRSAAGSGPDAVESADSNHLAADTADVFPPPVPAGLQAVAGVAGVDLSWDAVSAHDMAGYNVYRQTPGATGWEKRNAALVPTPVFHDPALPADPRGYLYAVTALDRAGNESPRSKAVRIR